MSDSATRLRNVLRRQTDVFKEIGDCAVLSASRPQRKQRCMGCRGKSTGWHGVGHPGWEQQLWFCLCEQCSKELVELFATVGQAAAELSDDR